MDEYRVVWKREGRRQSTAIYQSWSSAYRKACGILGLEAVKDETTYETMPDLEIAPIIQSRSVGAWEPIQAHAQVNEAGDYVKKEMVALYGKRPVEHAINVPF